jgi:hypothetical protein
VIDYSEHCIEAQRALKDLEDAAAKGHQKSAALAALRLLWAAISLHAWFPKLDLPSSSGR